MSLPRAPKKSQPPWLDLAFFAGVLAFVAFSVHMLLGTRGSGRQPASQREPVAARPPPAPSRHTAGATEVIRLPCLEGSGRAERRSHRSDAQLVQIQATLCDSASARAEWRAKNSSSGEEILVFLDPKESRLTTSYFHLAAGENKVSFQAEGRKRKPLAEELVITGKP